MLGRFKVAVLALSIGVHFATAAAPSARSSSQNQTHETLLRGGAWMYHGANDMAPCGFFTNHFPSCHFRTLASDERLVERWGRRSIVKHASVNDAVSVFSPFEDPLGNATVKMTLSRYEVYQLDTVDLEFTPRNFEARPDDWIGVYCHEDATKPAPNQEYIDWKWVNKSKPVEGRTRRMTFGPLVNMRCAWQFRYFARLSEEPTYTNLGESHLLRFALGNGEPLHVRLSVTTSPNEMRVMWVSGKVPDPHVVFGEDPQKLSQRVSAQGDTYAADDMCQAPATIVNAQHFRDPGMMYDAVLTNLQPDRDYYYKVGSSNGLMSRVFKFRIPPPPGHHPEGTIMSFFMYADLGEWTSAATGLSPPIRSGTTMQLVKKEMDTSGKNYIAVFHDGDISYARGMAFQWDQFGALVEPVAARIPYMVSVGNHEYDYTEGGKNDPSGAGATNGFHPPEGNYGIDSAGECAVPTNKRFHMPDNGNHVFWYSTEMGLTHHTVISSEHDYTPGAPMHEWLIRDLASVDRKRTPWVFLHLHRPLYVSEVFDADNRVADFLRKHLEPLLAKYRVDAVFSGHFHAFERTCPVLKEECRTRINNAGIEEARAPVHIMVGSAGADIDQTTYKTVSWSEAHQLEYGYGRVHVHNASHVHFEFQRNRDGKIADTAWIISTHDW